MGGDTACDRPAATPPTSCKAIDAAITDGVDVINYSISGSDDPTDPVDLMFLSAASAGIFVATSAGNSGPGASTLAHTSPWVTIGRPPARSRRTTAR